MIPGKRGGWGKRKVPGEMNKLEAEFALMLDADPQVEAWWFERFKWKLADNTFWTPDYLVHRKSEELVIYEVKGGFFPEHNRIKLKVAADQIPVRVVLAQFLNKKTGWTYTEV